MSAAGHGRGKDGARSGSPARPRPGEGGPRAEGPRAADASGTEPGGALGEPADAAPSAPKAPRAARAPRARSSAGSGPPSGPSSRPIASGAHAAALGSPSGADPGAGPPATPVPAALEPAAELLAWYDRHARALPWRVPPGSGGRADPYRVWLSEVMLQQTTVAAVRPYFERFTARWPGVRALAEAEDGEVMAAWAGLGYYARARNLLACARAVAALGAFPDSEAGLRALPGVGAYTAAAVAAIAFGRRAVVVDGNVERVMARLHAVEAPLPGARPALRAHAAALTPALRPGDHAQAVMDLGATVCTPRRPACGVCPWMARCAGRRLGLAETLPRKTPKAPRPERRGTLWIARRADGAWLMERRPARGMLGGTLGWPGTPWEVGGGRRGGGPTADPDPPAGGELGVGSDPPVAADWRAAGAIAHGFTHFTVTLDVLAAEVARDAVPERGAFVPPESFDPGALPTLMRRAHEAALLTPPGRDRARPPAAPPSSS